MERTSTTSTIDTHRASHSEDAGDAMTAEELISRSSPNAPRPGKDPSLSKRPNAFIELMSNAKKPKTSVDSTRDGDTMKSLKTLPAKVFGVRDGLLDYIEHPEKNPEGRVVEFDDEFVVINDKYPKASVHLLLLPRDRAYYSQHPLELLSSDPEFLKKVRTRVDRLKRLAANELRRQYGQHSISDAPYQSTLEQLMGSPDPPPPDKRDALLPPGRDWLKEIKAGVHTHPSMNHLHIHIISRDMHSDWMKHKKHYLSFTTSFLVQLEEFPLEKGSPRFKPGHWPNWDMSCWRCGKNFKNKFAALKRHIEDEEFEAWTKE